METFIQSCLKELRSPQETKNLIGELSSRITDHRGRVHELLRSEPLRHPEVVPLIMVGLAADRPIKSNFFPGLLEGLLGSLGMAAPGEGNPPASSREGAGHTWSTAMHEAISRIEQKEVEAPEAVGLPPNLDLRYKEGFLERQRHLIPPVSKALPSAHSHKVSSAPPQPGGGGPKQQVLNQKSLFQAPHSPLRKSRSRSTRLPTLIQTELMSLLRRRNHLVELSRSDFPLNSLSVVIRPRQAISRMGSHPPKCRRRQRLMRPRLAL